MGGVSMFPACACLETGVGQQYSAEKGVARKFEGAYDAEKAVGASSIGTETETGVGQQYSAEKGVARKFKGAYDAERAVGHGGDCTPDELADGCRTMMMPLGVSMFPACACLETGVGQQYSAEKGVAR